MSEPSLDPDLNNPVTPIGETTKTATQPHVAAATNVDVDYLIATLAFECVSRKEIAISSILQHRGYSGKYVIQVGFNEERLCFDEGTLEEIYLSLSGKLSHRVAADIADCLYPFPVYIYTSNKAHHFRTWSSSAIELRELWTSCGIYQASKNVQGPHTTSPPVEESEASGPPGDKGTSRQTGNEGASRGNSNGKGKQPARDNPDDNHTGGNRDGDDSGISGSANQPEASKHAAHVVKDVEVHLPFRSVLKASMTRVASV